MRIVVALLILALPIAEIVGLVKVGQTIGLWPTLGLVLAAGVAGVAVLRHQGFSTLHRLNSAIERGETAVRPLLEGLLIALAGVLLIVPGFISDVAGLVLLLPWVRSIIAARIARSVAARGDIHVETFDGTVYRRKEATPRDDGGGPVIEGEFTRIGERPLDQGSRRRDGEHSPPG